MKKKVISLLLSVVMMVTLSLNVFANSNIQPYWEYMNDITLSLYFSGKTGTATVTVGRIYSVTDCLTATLTIYEQVGDDWVDISSKSTTSLRSLFLDIDFTGESGVTYKAEAEITAYGSDGGSESETVSKIETCP